MPLERLSAKDLAAMPPALIGSGERAPAGLPHQGTHLNRMLKDPVKNGMTPQFGGQLGNALAGSAPSSMNLLAGRPSPQVNALTGTPMPPPQAPPPSMPPAMPPTMPMAAQPAAQAPLNGPAQVPGVPGQEFAGRIGNFVNAGQLCDADLASKGDRFMFMQNDGGG